MTDFKSIIDEAKKRSDASAAEQASALVQEQERKRAQVDAGIGWLETTAIPKLEEALTAFREKGVGLTITRNFDVAKTVDPRPSVTMSPRPTATVDDHSLHIDSDGRTFRVGITGTTQAGGWGLKVLATNEAFDKAILDAVKALSERLFPVRR